MHAINLEAVVDSEYPAVIRLAAAKLLQTPYLDAGTFLKELTKADLEELVGYCNAVTMRIDVPPMLESLMILAEMLAQAEGTPLDGLDTQRTSNLMILLTFEDLSRKGVITFNHAKATLYGDVTSVQNLARIK